MKTLAAAIAATMVASGASHPSAAPLIVFAADRAPTVTGDIYRVDASGRVANLTHSPWQETTPVVSPNGKVVAFVSDRSGGGVYRIVGRKAPLKIKRAAAAVLVAASSDDIAYVPASGAATADGRPLASADVPVEVLDARSGSRVASVSIQSTGHV